MRGHYRNGQEIRRQAGGCDGCDPAMINGVFCHETGCPYTWKDYPIDCAECGYEFYRLHRWQTVCPDCRKDADSADGEEEDK